MNTALWVIGGLAAIPLAILIMYLTVAMTGWYLYFFATLLGGV